jgi:hypothetical protein
VASEGIFVLLEASLFRARKGQNDGKAEAAGPTSREWLISRKIRLQICDEPKGIKQSPAKRKELKNEKS